VFYVLNQSVFRIGPTSKYKRKLKHNFGNKSTFNLSHEQAKHQLMRG